MWAPGKTRPAGDVGLSAPETEAPPLIWQQYYCICVLRFFFYCVKLSGLLISAFDTRIIYCLSVQGIIIILQTYPGQWMETGPFHSTYKNNFMQWTQNIDLCPSLPFVCAALDSTRRANLILFLYCGKRCQFHWRGPSFKSHLTDLMKTNCFGLNYSSRHMWSTTDVVVLFLHIQNKKHSLLKLNVIIALIWLWSVRFWCRNVLQATEIDVFRHVFIEVLLLDVQ